MSGFYGVHQYSMNFSNTGSRAPPVAAPIIQYDTFTEDHESHYEIKNEPGAIGNGLNTQQNPVYSQSGYSSQNGYGNYSSAGTSSQAATSAPPPNVKEESPPEEAVEQPQVDIEIVINNVVSTFNCRCHLNLKRIAMEGRNVEFRRENGVRHHEKF